MIPKRIFYVWGYGEKKSQIADICIENWRMMLPNYEIIEINEKTIHWFHFEQEYENNLWFKTVYDLKMWAYVADYIRVKTLYNHGGIYLDTDVTIYKDFEPLLNNKMFIGNCLNNIIEFAIFGVEKKHRFMKDMVDFYNKNIWKSPNYIIGRIFTDILKTTYSISPSLTDNVVTDIITIYKPEYLHPHHFDIPFEHKCITNNTYAVHWMGSSWHSKKNLFFLSNKHIIPLPTLLKQIKFIEMVDGKANDKTKISLGVSK